MGALDSYDAALRGSRMWKELYDVRKAVPKPEYYDRYARVKEVLHGMGVEFLY